MKEEKTFSDRLKELLGGDEMKPFARKCGVEEKSIRLYLKTDSQPTLGTLIKIAYACNVSVGWLAAGEGKKYLAKPGKISAGIMPGDDQTRARLLEAHQRPTVRNSNLRLLVEWMDREGNNNEVDFAFLFYEDTRARYSSFDKFIRERLSKKAGGVISEKKDPAANS